MDQDKNKDELESQLEQAAEQAQNGGSEDINTNQAGDNREDYNSTEQNKESQNQNGNGQGISPDLGTAKDQMKEDGIEIL